jgi:hypothetical protein
MATQPSTPETYPLSLLQAAWRGLEPKQQLAVTVMLPTGEIITGHIAGIGARLGIQTCEGRLVEDVQPEWVVHCDLQ